MTDYSHQTSRTLTQLGWSRFFEGQLDPSETGLARMRISSVHRTRLTALSLSGEQRLTLPASADPADHAVGDWVLAEPADGTLVRRLERRTLLQRRTEGRRGPQLIAANVDTLFIVTSCNDDFNVARLERYLVLANEAGATPVIVLTKADRVADVAPYLDQVRGLQSGVAAATLDARSKDAARVLAPWCGAGQTIALVGSSGVGKSSLLNTLADKAAAEAQLTGAIREADSRGRHTTTSRSLHAIAGDAWVIDTPGIRTLHVSDISDGLDIVFAEIVALAPHCRFGNCTHSHEPGCAVSAAVAAGAIDPRRVARWRKLLTESGSATPGQSRAHRNKVARSQARPRER
ncbi:ribosome small subunit-dependent GTPase A [Paracoccus sp. NSM]|uniref:ribosome small subunit-dependent GTPase A n=1 Tax=Paracoccus sp. NSM TaxID=3457784 RepID=UPI0040359E71